MGPTQDERSRLREYPFMTYRLYLYLRESFESRKYFDAQQTNIFEKRQRSMPIELCEPVSYVEYNILLSAWQNPHIKENRGVIFRLGYLGNHGVHTSAPDWFNIWYVRYFSDSGIFKIKRQRSGLYRTEKAAVHAATGRDPSAQTIIEAETKEDVLNYLLLVSAT